PGAPSPRIQTVASCQAYPTVRPTYTPKAEVAVTPPPPYSAVNPTPAMSSPAPMNSDLQQRLTALEQQVLELRKPMERQGELQRQVASLTQTVHRLSAVSCSQVRCSCPELKQILGLTLQELEKLSRRVNEAWDRSAASSIKQIQELQHLTACLPRGEPGAEDGRESEATCSPIIRPEEDEAQGSPWRRLSSDATCPGAADTTFGRTPLQNSASRHRRVGVLDFRGRFAK
ncbi:unnamed protein product, partial [Effrenium voratum]